ncbi:hypothetical protein C9374_002471 [Naegleria lovaniensis]|uniref:Actin-related protein n=1 Tax=Naegleria lovaniensis TaxID=51637 RepID=A0AA88KQS3_NAELO|nr:uncharacterized protein C9374_002471 [Naegleria lovaniensis]KAG2386727.1 hypothetical protein C9374_002471 [Naegleria lovaniensis]
MQRTLGNATMGLHALPLAQHGNLEKVQHDLGVTGLVIDCGYSECRVVPVLFGSILSMCVEILPIGSKHVLRNLKELLCGDVASSTNIDNHQEHLMLEDVLSRLCFCSYPSADNNDSNSQTIIYKYSVGSVEIPVTHKTRTKSCEFIFEPLTRAIIECVKRLETEARGQVLRNVIVCGGLSELNGFKQRLIAVLNKHVLAQDFGSNKNWLKHMGINTFNPTRSSLLNWYGASIAFSHYSYAQSKTIKHDQ